MKTIAYAAAGLLVASAAIAQTSTTTTPAPASPSTSAPSTMPNAGTSATTSPQAGSMSQDGMKMATGGMDTVRVDTARVTFKTVAPTDTVTSRLRGVSVVNKQNEKLGDVEDFVIKDGRAISGVIVGVGGFLGLGERYVAVPPSALTLVRDGSSFKAVMNTTKDDLNNAPKFEYTRSKS